MIFSSNSSHTKGDSMDKPDKKTDPIGYINWITEKQKQGALSMRAKLTKEQLKENAHKAWETKRSKKLSEE
jgi:hypothetical protein